MSSQNTEQHFIKTFNSMARHQHRYQVFRDFVVLSAISLHNSVAKNDTLEAEYMEVIGKYSKEEAQKMAELLGCLIDLLDPKPTDVLGQLYLTLELGNTNAGQFFTPASVSDMMAQILYDDVFQQFDKPFITLSEPASGAGGMVLAFVNAIIKDGHNPANKLWVQCVDLDRTVALMCYLQLSLWNVPAQIIVGNTLTLEYREQYFTPAHYVYGWDAKLRYQKMLDYVIELENPIDQTSQTKAQAEVMPQPQEPPKRRISTDAGQLKLF